MYIYIYIYNIYKHIYIQAIKYVKHKLISYRLLAIINKPNKNLNSQSLN